MHIDVLTITFERIKTYPIQIVVISFYKIIYKVRGGVTQFSFNGKEGSLYFLSEARGVSQILCVPATILPTPPTQYFLSTPSLQYTHFLASYIKHDMVPDYFGSNKLDDEY